MKRMSSLLKRNVTFQDGEMPRMLPAQVKFTTKSWFGLRKTYKVIKQTISHENLATAISYISAFNPV